MTPDQLNDLLPRGLWFDADKNRFRVRVYKNRRPLNGGYHETLHQAIDAYEELLEHRELIPSKRETCPDHMVFDEVCAAIFSSGKTRRLTMRIPAEAMQCQA